MTESPLYKTIFSIAIQVLISTGTVTYIAYEHPHIINVTPSIHEYDDSKKFKHINERLKRLEKEHDIVDEVMP